LPSKCPRTPGRSPGPVRHPVWRGRPFPGYFTGFHAAHRSDVNCPSDDRIVTVIFRADVANELSMISPDSAVRSQ